MERGEIARVLKRARDLRLPSVRSWFDSGIGQVIDRDSVPYRIRCILNKGVMTEEVVVILPAEPKPVEAPVEPKKQPFLSRLFQKGPAPKVNQKPPTPRPSAPPPETVLVYQDGWLVDGPWQEAIPRILAATERDCDRVWLEQVDRARRLVAR